MESINNFIQLLKYSIEEISSQMEDGNFPGALQTLQAFYEKSPYREFKELEPALGDVRTMLPKDNLKQIFNFLSLLQKELAKVLSKKEAGADFSAELEEARKTLGPLKDSIEKLPYPVEFRKKAA